MIPPLLAAALIASAAMVTIPERAAAQAAGAAAPPGFAWTAARGFVISRDVIGQPATTRENFNRDIGRLLSLVLTAPGGQALYAIVDVGGFLGIGAKPVAVPFALVHFEGQYDRPSLALPAAKLAGAPDAPDDRLMFLLADPAWRRRVADYWAPELRAAAAPASQAGSAPPPFGWYTAEQAARGAQDFAANCAGCHGADLSGGAGPALAGQGFLERWGQRTLADLDTFEHSQMPLNAPGSLSAQQYADITSFILQRNGFTAGTAPLAQDSRRLLHPSPAARDLQGRLAANAPLPGTAAAAAPSAVPVRQPTSAGPTPDEILGADASTTSWPFFNKGLLGYRYSTLAQINAANASDLRVVCAYQVGEVGSFQTGPVMHDGLVYVTTTRGTYAFDAVTCRPAWSHQHVPTGPEVTTNSKGAALAGGRVIRGSQDGHLFALDAKTGTVLWDRVVMDSTKGEFVTAVPIVWNGLVFVGKAGGDWGIVGEMMAFDARDGTKIWGLPMIPTGSQPGADTWPDPAAASRGGGSTWTTYSLDPATGTLFVPVGNPGPDFNNGVRVGANLYTNSVVALDAMTGRLVWWYQLVPNDYHDWDTSTVSLFDGPDGRKLVAAAGKDGVLHVLDRATGALVFKLPVTTRLNVDVPITPEGTRYCPGTVGGVEWNGTAYSPATGHLYVNAVDWCVTSMLGPPPTYVAGEVFTGLKNGFGTFDPADRASGWTNAVNAATGQMGWRYHSPTPMIAAVTPTAGDLLFTGDLNGFFLALHARTGEVLYRFNTGGAIGGGVITYEVAGRQYAAVASGNASRTTWYTAGSATVFVFGS